MALTPEEATLLAKYRSAFAALISGERVSEVTSGGRTVKYGQADLERLEKAIAELEARASAPSPSRRRGAVGFRL